MDVPKEQSAHVGGLGIQLATVKRERGNLHTQRPLIIHFSRGGASEGLSEGRFEGSYSGA